MRRTVVPARIGIRMWWWWRWWCGGCGKEDEVDG